MRVHEMTPDDVEAAERLHERSVRELAAAEYDETVVEAWVRLGDEENDEGDGGSDGETSGGEAAGSADASDTDLIHPQDGRRFVAEVEDCDGPTVAGFGDVRFDPPEYISEPADGGVRAVYVDPEFARRGVGTALLERLEREARERDLDTLGLLASVNAVPFYERNGYDRVTETTFEFGDGVEGPAVEMRTEL